MKKLGVIFAIIALVTVIAVTGCGTGSGSGKADRYSADLSTFSQIKNPTAFTKVWDSFDVPFPAFPVDITQFRRVTVRLKAYDGNGNDITAWSNNGVARLLKSMQHSSGAPANGTYGELYGANADSNAYFVEVNTGFEGLGSISSNEGTLMGLGGSTPAGFNFECNSADVKFIEITEIIFHNGSAAAPVAAGSVFAGSDLGTFDMPFLANFQYGRTWQALFKQAELLNGYRLQKGDELELTVTYSTSRDLTNPVIFAWANTGGNPWASLSLAEEVTDLTESSTVVPASKAGEVVSATIKFDITRNGGGGAAGNTLVVETVGNQAQGPVTFSFTEFKLVKTNN